jgi:NAD(P)-dependent dehydrogenase (short-subunit alcohol dehydrogenase family)
MVTPKTTFLITGANRGIGFALAEKLIARGDRVIATVRDPFKVPDLLRTAPREQALIIGMDVRDQRSVDRAAASLKEPVDVLVNNAGIKGPDRQTALEMDFAGFAETLAVNTLAPLRVAQAFLPHLRQSKNPRILTISSQMGALAGATTGSVAYRASKAAVNKAMQCLATELKPEGIAVCVAHPGWVQTDMGGSAADITPAQSADGLATLMDGLTQQQTGQFFRWDGTIHPW